MKASEMKTIIRHAVKSGAPVFLLSFFLLSCGAAPAKEKQAPVEAPHRAWGFQAFPPERKAPADSNEIAAVCGETLRGVLVQDGVEVPEDMFGSEGKLYPAFVKACRDEDADSCALLGVLHGCGIGMDVDYKIAERFFTQSCDLGDPTSCAWAAIILRDGLSPESEPDPDGAAKSFGKGCELGDAYGCIWAGYLLIWGHGLAQRVDAGVDFLEEGCSLSSAHGCYWAGLGLLKQKDNAARYKEAFKRFSTACDGGLMEACIYCGDMLSLGAGTKKNLKKAFNHYEKACGAGYGEACFSAGVMAGQGSGTKQDMEKAQDLYKQACDLGYETACEEKPEPPDPYMKLVKPKIGPKPFLPEEEKEPEG